MLFSPTFIPEFIYLFAKINFPFSLIYTTDIYACIVISNVYANFVAFMYPKYKASNLKLKIELKLSIRRYLNWENFK